MGVLLTVLGVHYTKCKACTENIIAQARPKTKHHQVQLLVAQPHPNNHNHVHTIICLQIIFTAVSNFAKECLLTGQEQACSKFTWLLVCCLSPYQNCRVRKKCC